MLLTFIKPNNEKPSFVSIKKTTKKTPIVNLNVAVTPGAGLYSRLASVCVNACGICVSIRVCERARGPCLHLDVTCVWWMCSMLPCTRPRTVSVVVFACGGLSATRHRQTLWPPPQKKQTADFVRLAGSDGRLGLKQAERIRIFFPLRRYRPDESRARTPFFSSLWKVKLLPQERDQNM